MPAESSLSDLKATGGALRANVLIGIILGTAIVIRVAFAQYMPPERTWSDASAYHGIAANLIEGRGYTLNGTDPTRIRPPTYPGFLAAIYLVTGPHPGRAVLVQSLVGCLTCLVVYELGRRIYASRAGLLAAAVTAAYPALVYYDTRILRGGLCAFLFTLAVWLALCIRSRYTARRAVLYGLLVAVLSLCRPELLVPAAAVGLLFIWPPMRLGAKLSRGLLVALPVVLLWVPWTARNYVAFGTLSPVTAGLGSVLWFGNRWADIGGDYHTSEDRQNLQARTRKLLQTDEAEIDGRFREEAVADLLQRPTWYARMVARKMVMFWRDANGVKKTLPRIHPALSPLLNTYYYGLLLLAVVAVWYGRSLYPLAPRLFAVVVSFMMTYALLHVRNRYRVPVLPVVFVLSAGGFWMLLDLVRRVAADRTGHAAATVGPPSPGDAETPDAAGLQKDE